MQFFFKTGDIVILAYSGLAIILSLFFSTGKNTVIVSLLGIVGVPVVYIMSSYMYIVQKIALINLELVNLGILVIVAIFLKVVRVDLDEKTTLIGEIQHRVVNTLQVVNGLIKLQLADVADPVTDKAQLHLRDLTMVLSLVHKNIYTDSNFHSVNFSNVVLQLMQLHHGKEKSKEVIFPDSAQTQIDLRIERALPLSIILYELLNLSKKSSAENLSLFIRRDENRISVMLRGIDPDKSFSVHPDEKNSCIEKTLIKILSMQIESSVAPHPEADIIYAFSFDDLTENMKFI